MLLKKQLEIIKLLLSSPTYITTYDISQATNINRRLIKEEMPQIKEILLNLDCIIISKPGKGYVIENKTPQIISKVNNFIKQSETKREDIYYSKSIERVGYMTKRMIETDGYIKIDEFVDELVVSRSTVSKDLSHLKNNLKKYDLKIVQKPYYGMKIVGKEKNLRDAIIDFLFGTIVNSELIYDYLNNYLDISNSIEYGIIEILKRNKTHLSDIALCDVLISLSCSLSRVMNNFTINEHPLNFKQYQDRNEIKTAYEIAEYLSNKTSINFNEFEIENIAMMLICKRSSYGLQPTKTYDYIVHDILDEIEKETLITFNSPALYETLHCYVDQTIVRLEQNEKIRNPFYLDLKQKQPMAHTLALITTKVIEKHLNKKLRNSEITSITSFFNTALIREKYQKKNVLLISGLSGNSLEYCAYNIMEKFFNQINIKNAIFYHSLNDENLSDYDFIISTIPIHKKLPIPSITISHLITIEDFDQIENHLTYYYYKDILKRSFLPSLYKSHSISKNQKEVAKEMIGLLNNIYPYIKKSIHENILFKESNIIFFKQITLIRLHQPISKNNDISIICLDNSITINKHKSKIFILLSCIDDNSPLYNIIFNSLNSISNNKNALSQLLKADTYAQFLSIFLQHA